jgi:GTP cyclohydrolase I
MEHNDFDDTYLAPEWKESFDQEAIEKAISQILEAFGENPQREGLKNTPRRVSHMFVELLAGYTADPISLVNDAIFEVSYDEMVLVRDIEFYSMCEHHL